MKLLIKHNDQNNEQVMDVPLGTILFAKSRLIIALLAWLAFCLWKGNSRPVPLTLFASSRRGGEEKKKKETSQCHGRVLKKKTKKRSVFF